MASNDGWEDVPVDAEHGWEDVPVAKQAPLKFAKPGDVGANTTAAAHFARHFAYGLGDKIMAGVHAVNDKIHDKTGKVTLSDAYKRDLAFNDAALDASDELHPEARWLGNVAGIVGSIAAPGSILRAGQALRGVQAAAEVAPAAATGAKALWALAKSGAKAGSAAGAVGGFGQSRADDLGDVALDTAVGSALGGVTGGLLGAGLPYVASKAGPLLKRFANVRAVKAIGGIQKDLNKMTPEEVQALGNDLLSRGIIKPWSSKQGMYEAISEHLEGAGKKVGGLLSAADNARPWSPERTYTVPVSDLADVPAVPWDPSRAGPVAEALAAGKELPPIKITTDAGGEGGVRAAVDGNHRLAIARKLGVKELPVQFSDEEAAQIAQRPSATGPNPLTEVAKEKWAAWKAAGKDASLFERPDQVSSAPQSTSGYGDFDVPRAVNRIKSDLVGPMADNPVRMEAANSALRQMRRLANGRTKIPFSLANEIKGDMAEGLYSKLDPALKIKLSRQLGGIFNSEIENQLGETLGADSQQAFKAAKNDYGLLADAKALAKQGADRAEGNHFISLHDAITGGAVFGASHDPVKAMVAALGVKLAKNYGNNMSAVSADAMSRALRSATSAAPLSTAVSGDASSEYTAALIRALRNRAPAAPVPADMFAQEDSQ